MAFKSSRKTVNKTIYQCKENDQKFDIWDHCAQWSASVKVAGAVGCLQTAESLSG